MDKKSLLKDYFNFTRKERIAVLIITGLLIAVFFLPVFTKRSAAGMTIKEDSAWTAAVQQLKKASTDSVADNEPVFVLTETKAENKAPVPTSGLFHFDPNTISADQWRRLGVKEKTISTIKNYLSKCGAFRKPEDLQKIYGLGKKQYHLLEPYVKIETPDQDYSSKKNEREKTNADNASHFTSRLTVIDINVADTAQLISLPGIGSRLAARIIGFREKLGGFYSVDQIGETYGLHDSVFQKIKKYFQCNENAVKKININTGTKEELKTHPYIRWNNANAIVEYRNQHGPFHSLDDLEKVNVFDSQTLKKIAHYLVL